MFIAQDGFFVSADSRGRHAEFGRNYLRLRDREGRSFTAAEVRSLPDVPRSHPHYREWRMRQDTIRRLMKYLREQRRRLKILDVGCGNGFLSNLIAQAGHDVTGVDISQAELRLAVQAFGAANPAWYCADITTEDLPGTPFDLILFNASFQYFGNANELLDRCFSMLSAAGTVHILETPVYRDDLEAAAAKNRAVSHFTELGVQGMSGYYNTVSWDFFKGLRYLVKKAEPGYLDRLLRHVSPFPWIVIPRQ